MAEKFESEKPKIKSQVRKLFLVPCSELCRRFPGLFPDEHDKVMAIYWHFSGNCVEEFRREIGNYAAIFPAFLTTLNGDLSEHRVKFLAEFVLTEARNLRIGAEKRRQLFSQYLSEALFKRSL